MPHRIECDIWGWRSSLLIVVCLILVARLATLTPALPGDAIPSLTSPDQDLSLAILVSEARSRIGQQAQSHRFSVQAPERGARAACVLRSLRSHPRSTLQRALRILPRRSLAAGPMTSRAPDAPADPLLS